MRRLRRKVVVVLAILASVVVVPIVVSPTAALAAPCDMSPDLAPEIVGGGVDGLVKPPPPDSAVGASTGGQGVGGQTGAGATTTTKGVAEPLTNYDRYGMAGQFWHTYGLGCTDMAAVLGNAWANTVFSWAKAIDRMTITTYQAAATEGPLQSIKDVVDDIVTNLANAMYWPYLRVIILLGAVWLAWYGLIRKRASTTAEGVIWMILAVTVAVWFFSRPGDFTGLGKTVTDKTGEVVNSAFSGLPGAGGASCLPTKGQTNAKAGPGGYGQSGTPGVAQNADALWSTLVCKPWLMGTFGTADPNAPIVKTFGAKMLDIQATDAQEQTSGQRPSSGAHQARFEEEVAKPLENTPMFFLFQGKDWTSRLGIAIGALMAAMVTGVLIFLVAVSLIALKIGFLLLLILGPVFLLIGVHPGSGRIIAMRWVEMLVGTLLRQAVLALVLGVLVYGYALIISTNLPWGMQIMFIALLTIAVFFYRRPFQHLFSSMDGHTLTTRMLGEAASAPTLSRAANALPPVAAARVGRWGLRKAEPVINAAAMAGGGVAAATASQVAQGRVRGEEVAPGATQQSGTRVPVGAQPAPLDADGQAGARRKATGRGTAVPRPGAAPPLNLSGRPGGSGRMGGSGRAGGPGATGPRPAVRTGTGTGTGTGPGTGAGAGAGAGGGGSAGGWFGGRAGGGWASRSGSSGGSSGGSSSGSSRRSEGTAPRAPRSTAGGPRGFSGGGGSAAGSSGGSSGRSSGSSGRSSGGSAGSLFGGSSGRSSGGSAGSLFGGSSGRSNSSSGRGSSNGSGRSSSGSSGGSGGSSGGSSGRPGRSSGSSSGWLSGGGRSGSGEAPPLWLPPRSDSGRGEPESAPFWLRPADRDKD
ncbi:type IV secretion system protein [Sphaerisporangium flaviroseum]